MSLSYMSFSGRAQFSEAVGYPMVQQWRVRSNLYKVKLSSITLSTGQHLDNITGFFISSKYINSGTYCYLSSTHNSLNDTKTTPASLWVCLMDHQMHFFCLTFNLHLSKLTVCPFVFLPHFLTWKAFLRFWRPFLQTAHVKSYWPLSRNTAAIMCLRRFMALSSAAASTSPARKSSSSFGCSTRKVGLMK